MKKALVVFLILAVAGGLFAQITFSGAVQTGLGVGFSDQEDGAGDPKIDYIRDRGDTGMRAELTAAYTSPDDKAPYGKFGGSIRLRGSATKFVNDGWAVSVPVATLWWTPIDILRIDIGTNDPGGFGTMAGLDESNGVRNGDAGLKIGLTPIPGLSLGAHAAYGRSLLLFENMGYRFGAKYTVDGLLSAAANIRLYPDVKDYTKLQFAAGAQFLGLSGMGLKIAADFGAYDFGNTARAYMGIGERIDYALGGLALVARAQQFIATGDALNKDFMPMLFRGEVNYTINSIVSAGIEGVYMMGNIPDVNYRHAVEGMSVNSADSFGRDKAVGLAVSPRLTFNVGPTVILGYNFRTNMTDGFTASATAPKTHHLIYAITNISF
jgi:hypothetical protein